ncbi:MAG: glutathione S-transferase N-terminal domain-containing protein [Candidatus Omnitrophica bacterium]|nr:glutathione S-transferase N-terminal domain-containing protein [Candidatus Omnitrophota bacterium]
MQLTLYYFQGCPFCGRVLAFIEEHGILLEKKDIHEIDEFKQELISIGGKSQVPCLVIDEKPMYESADIIEWLKKNVLPSN